MSANPHDKEADAEAERDAERATVRKYVKNVYRLIDDNLSAVGGIEVAAGFCGVDRGELRRAIDRGTPQQPRYLAVDHVVAIMTRMRRHSAAKATEIAANLTYSAGLLVFPLVDLPADEKVRRYERLIRSMPLGDQLIENALKTP